MRERSQAALYGELLNSEDQYRQDIAKIPHCTEAERHLLIDRARNGEKDARNQFALSFTGYITSVARKYTTAYADFSPRIEFLDLAQLAHMIVIERMEKALQHPNPIGFLNKTIAGTILTYCSTRASLITSPRDHHGAQPTLHHESLDAPVSSQSNRVLGDTICVELCLPGQGQEKDYTPLYQAIDVLTEDQKELITRYYGIGCAAELLADIRNRKRVRQGLAPLKTRGGIDTSMRTRALKKLHEVLEPVYASA